jgi:hypothetical protein
MQNVLHLRVKAALAAHRASTAAQEAAAAATAASSAAPSSSSAASAPPSAVRPTLKRNRSQMGEADDADAKEETPEERKQRLQEEATEAAAEANKAEEAAMVPLRARLSAELLSMATNTRIILHADTATLIERFLTFKKQFGSSIEQALYANMSSQQFILRCISQRPLVFWLPGDSTLLRDGRTQFSGGFLRIGTEVERAPLLLRDYLSYDELALSALLSVSVPTWFINDGSRGNRGKHGAKGSFEPEGILTAQVGARFERRGVMEWTHLLVTYAQNTPVNGYGADAAAAAAHPAADEADARKHARARYMQLWASFYGQPFLPTFEEVLQRVEAAREDGSDSGFFRVDDDTYLNVAAFKSRLRAVLVPFLMDASRRARSSRTTAFLRVVGLGLGVWSLSGRASNCQGRLMVAVYRDILLALPLPGVSDVEFLWMEDDAPQGGLKHGERFEGGENGNRVHVTFTKGVPNAPLEGEHKGKLLVTNYAWDSNSFRQSPLRGQVAC